MPPPDAPMTAPAVISPATADEFAQRLGAPLSLAVATEPLAPHRLTAGELAYFEALRSPSARGDWMLGRAALKALVPGDATRLRFPHPSLSISHAGGVGVAVRSDSLLRGVGVDVEPWRDALPARLGAFFLRPAEVAVVDSPADLVRLWTIKEALFKALPNNARCTLLDIELIDAAASAGSAHGPNGQLLRYASIDIEPGPLSAAVNPVARNR